jgi:hypothetical protein
MSPVIHKRRCCKDCGCGQTLPADLQTCVCICHHDDRIAKRLRDMSLVRATTPLEDAALLIEGHMATLNLTSRTCECCQRETFQSFPDRNEHTELEAVVKKLRRYAAKRG